MKFAIYAILPIVALYIEEPAKTTDRQVVLTVQIKSEKPVTFTADELGKLDRVKVQTGEDQIVYEGVPLAKIFQAAGVKLGPRYSQWGDCYVVVKGADEYITVFSIFEIDPKMAYTTVLLADRRNGKAISKVNGPYQIIESNAKDRCRWVKQVTEINIREAADEAPASSHDGKDQGEKKTP